jgi:hypothetical protein
VFTVYVIKFLLILIIIFDTGCALVDLNSVVQDLFWSGATSDLTLGSMPCLIIESFRGLSERPDIKYEIG